MTSSEPDTDNNGLQICHFAGFRFDMRSLELWHGETKIPLKPQPATFLRTLIAAAPDFVSRDALIAELWPDGMIVEFDQGLNSCARQVRKALEQMSDRPSDPQKFIETLPRRGYRFVGQIDERRTKPIRIGSLVAVLIILLLGVSIAAIIPQLGREEGGAIPGTSEQRDALLSARHGLASGDIAALENARDEYSRLLALSPGNGEARGGGALAMALLAGRSDYDWDAVSGEAEQRAEATLVDHADQPEALIALAYIKLYRDWNLRAARAFIDRALAVDPERDLVLALAASVYAAAGDRQSAADYADRAALANPQSMSVRSDRCWFHLFNRDPEAAQAACRWALRLAPDNRYPRLALAEALSALGDGPAAASEMAAILGDSGADRQLNEYHCALSDRLQGQDAAGRSAVLAAAAAVRCGDHSLAIAELQAALASRESGMLFLAIDPRFDALRSHPDMRSINAQLATISGA